MVNISPALQDKIERRARRAFSRFDEGSTPRLHRITNLGKERLKYRIPRSGRTSVEVVRRDRNIIVDPPTTGLIDVLKNDVLKTLKNSTDKLHAGEVTAYLLVDKVKKVGKTYKKAEKFFSREELVGKVKRDQHVYVIDFAGTDIENVGWDHVEASNYTVTSELDPIKDIGFTDGLLDLKTKVDVEKLQRHVGQIRAYMHVKAGTNYGFPATYQKKSKPLTSREQSTERFKVGDHVYVVETEYDDTTLGKDGTSEFFAREWEITEELDLTALGFTTGLFDLLTKSDVEKLREKKHLGRVRAYKYTDKNAESPVQSPKIKYVPGKDYKIKNADTDPGSACHKGINVADVAWAKGSATNGNRLFAFEFEMEDIAAVPTNTDGKFRVHRCKCVEELDPKTLKPLKRALESNVKKTKKKKKKGLMDKLLGRKDKDEDES
jgi:hypothetical protein